MSAKDHRSPPVSTDSPPDAVVALAAGRSIRCVWENEARGRTFELGAGDDRAFVKWAPAGSRINLPAEAARMTWAVAYTPVPTVLDQGFDALGSWLMTSPLPGRSAVARRWKLDPSSAVAAIGTGLRALHDALPAASCPYSWDVHDRVAAARQTGASGAADPARWHEEHRGLDVERAIELVEIPPPIDRLVVCHGDACAPNTMLTDDGRWSGHVDLEALGLADRWADLAIATWSTHWNYGDGWEATLLAAYGVSPDPERTRYYRLLWDLG